MDPCEQIRGVEEPDTIVVVGAHYDSRSTMNSSPTQARSSLNSP